MDLPTSVSSTSPSSVEGLLVGLGVCLLPLPNLLSQGQQLSTSTLGGVSRELQNFSQTPPSSNFPPLPLPALHAASTPDTYQLLQESYKPVRPDWTTSLACVIPYFQKLPPCLWIAAPIHSCDDIGPLRLSVLVWLKRSRMWEMKMVPTDSHSTFEPAELASCILWRFTQLKNPFINRSMFLDILKWVPFMSMDVQQSYKSFSENII